MVSPRITMASVQTKTQVTFTHIARAGFESDPGGEGRLGNTCIHCSWRSLYNLTPGSLLLRIHLSLAEALCVRAKSPCDLAVIFYTPDTPLLLFNSAELHTKLASGTLLLPWVTRIQKRDGTQQPLNIHPQVGS